MEDGNKVGLGAAFAALLAGAAHFGDDLARGAARLVSHERPAASALDDVAAPAAEGAISSLGPSGAPAEADRFGEARLQFRLVLASSAADLSRRWPGLVAFEDGRTIRVGFLRHRKGGHSVIDLEDDGSLAGTPLASCRSRFASDARADVRRCVDRALSEMAGMPAGFEARDPERDPARGSASFASQES